jgi:DNA-binding transcriptional MerR regulator
MDVDEFGGDGPAPTWSVGELAAATGLNVQTLQGYAEAGLVSPSLHHHTGRRRYTPADVLRLHRVTALRGLGLSPVQVAAVLDDPGLDARELLRRQLDQVEDRLTRGRHLRDRLIALAVLLDDGGLPSAPELVQLMAEMTAMDPTPAGGTDPWAT